MTEWTMTMFVSGDPLKQPDYWKRLKGNSATAARFPSELSER
jgi:hypothetical protein